MHVLSLVALLTVVSLLPSNSAEAQERFSADAVALLEQVTQAYDLNGKRMPAGRFDDAVLDRLAASADEQVRDLTEMVRGLKLIQTLNRQQGRVVGEAFRAQAAKFPGIMAERLAEVSADPAGDEFAIQSAAKTVEALLGTEPQKAVNRAWAIAYVGNGLGNHLKGRLRDLAAQAGNADGPAESIVVSLATEPGRLGNVTVLNRGKAPLHHCLIITRLEADEERIQAAAEEEDKVGKSILPALGLSPTTVEGSREAARLRYAFSKQDKGVVVYVAEIPPGGRVTTMLAAPGYYAVARGADVSFWSDEAAIEHKPASNWEAARQAVLRSARSPVAKRGRSTPAATPTDLFAPGSVWQGTSKFVQAGSPAVTRQIEIRITERDGDSFKGKVRYSGSRALSDIEGSSANGVVHWEFVTNGNSGLPHDGKIKGKRMEVTYEGTGDGDAPQKGTITLNYVSPRRR